MAATLVMALWCSYVLLVTAAVCQPSDTVGWHKLLAEEHAKDLYSVSIPMHTGAQHSTSCSMLFSSEMVPIFAISTGMMRRAFVWIP